MPQSDCINWPASDGEISSRIRAADWSATKVGPIARWPQSLKTAVDILLRLPMPAVLLWGKEGMTIYNDACLPFAGTLQLTLFGNMLAEHGSRNKDFKQCMRKVLKDGVSCTYHDLEVTLCRNQKNSRAWLGLNCSPVPDERGKLAGVFGIFIESTERMQAKQALQENEQCLSAIFARAQVGLSVISVEGRFLRVNDALCAMLGRTREKLLSSGLQDVTHPDDLEKSFSAVGQLLATGESVSIDKRYLRADGALVFVNSIISRLEDWQGQKYAVLAVSVDLTERKRALEALAASEARFRALSEASPALIWQLDPLGCAVYMNSRHLELVGMPPEKLSGFAWKSILHPDDLAGYLQQLTAAQREVKVMQQRMRIRCADGQWHWMDAHVAPWFAADGHYAGHVGIAVDINDAVRAQEELLISNERLNLAIEGSGGGIWDWHKQADKIFYSERARHILGLRAQEEIHRYEDWERRVHPDDFPLVLAGLRAGLDGIRPSINIECRIRSGAGEWCWILVRAIVVLRDAHNMPLRMTGMITDISEKRRSEEVTWHHANFDSLTGLPNRRLFRDRIDHEVKKAQRTGLPLALLFIDLDRFKEANDLLGHDVGDCVLIEAGKRICGCVRQSDTVARLGGDEFTAILTELDDLAHVETIAQKINEALATPIRIGDEVVYLSASIGITLYPNDASTAENLIRNADQAMYGAKNSGRNQFSYFTPSMQREAHDRLRLIGDLRNALARDQLKVHYQPVVHLDTGRVVKAEALLRWQHPRLGMIEPLRFIAFAEEAGLITEIGDWVFRQAAGCSRRWGQQMGAPFQVSINKSPIQFLPRSKEENWLAYLHGLGLTGSSVAVEITEGLLLNASPAVVGKLLQYRDAGIQVAIDDFGTGYSSMAYLKKFDIDYLKIDQSFIRDMVSNDSDRAIVRSVTAMAHELGMQVIAEGIETAEQRALLLEANCDFGQGFLFSEAIPADAFAHVLCP